MWLFIEKENETHTDEVLRVFVANGKIFMRIKSCLFVENEKKLMRMKSCIFIEKKKNACEWNLSYRKLSRNEYEWNLAYRKMSRNECEWNLAYRNWARTHAKEVLHIYLEWEGKQINEILKIPLKLRKKT